MHIIKLLHKTKDFKKGTLLYPVVGSHNYVYKVMVHRSIDITMGCPEIDKKQHMSEKHANREYTCLNCSPRHIMKSSLFFNVLKREMHWAGAQ